MAISGSGGVAAGTAAIASRIDALEAEGRLAGLHGLVVRQRGGVLFERYWSGQDNARGRPLGMVAFGPDMLHDLRSVTKSLVGLLYGIARADGIVPEPDAPLLAAFPEYGDLAADPVRAGWTVRHALTMTLGTAWDESLPYTSLANSEIAMEVAPDRLRYVLDRPFVAAPGARWIYSGGATALLGALIARGSGGRLSDYARARLFGPLRLGPTEWAVGRDGAESAASGLRMAPRDLARLGETVLGDGRGPDGTAVIPAEWIAESFQPAIVLPDERRYGYHWYLGRYPRSGGFEPWRAAIGNGGQRLFLFPRLQAVVAIAAGNYNAPRQDLVPAAVLREAILPALDA